MNRITEKFRQLRRVKQSAFIAFITAGFPSLAVTSLLIREFERIGVDIIELGVPFSDPMADGPVIQQASIAALRTHTTLKKILRMVTQVRRVTEIPICLMTYYNPIFHFGEARFIKAAAAAGVDGVIIPDLPVEEAASFMQTARRYGVATIFFLAPTTAPQRIPLVDRCSTGFIYYVSLTGVTGSRSHLPADLMRSLARVKQRVSAPLCVGFGIGRPAQVRQLGRVADGVIVGSAIVRQMLIHRRHPQMVAKVVRFVRRLKGKRRGPRL